MHFTRGGLDVVTVSHVAIGLRPSRRHKEHDEDRRPARQPFRRGTVKSERAVRRSEVGPSAEGDLPQGLEASIPSQWVWTPESGEVVVPVCDMAVEHGVVLALLRLH